MTKKELEAKVRELEQPPVSLCTSCNYPIPSWQHNGACKPVAEKVPGRRKCNAKRLPN